MSRGTSRRECAREGEDDHRLTLEQLIGADALPLVVLAHAKRDVRYALAFPVLQHEYLSCQLMGFTAIVISDTEENMGAGLSGPTN